MTPGNAIVLCSWLAQHTLTKLTLISSLAEGRTETPPPNKKNARAYRAGQRPIRNEKNATKHVLKSQTPNFLDHLWSRCGEARFVFRWLLYFE